MTEMASLICVDRTLFETRLANTTHVEGSESSLVAIFKQFAAYSLDIRLSNIDAQCTAYC